ncbi:19496_t:CDS:2 [Funneliformis geosporum]|uniref:12968_t:CDS:1 n=1 Tax=Funneliformis geosporum TaxID=1117311 RepID=A0A9W4SF02_9GLOM|nr:12968_t:CDS:2 [Funneliformis geosporum]CAI2164907.1 19496_t:CDS:2 [Funneliformis geosporum]
MVCQDDNRLNQLSDPHVSVESVLGEKDIYETQRVLHKIELFLKNININNDDVLKWYSDKDIDLLVIHEMGDLHYFLSGGILKPVKKKSVKGNKHENEIYDDDNDEEPENPTCNNDGSDSGGDTH